MFPKNLGLILDSPFLSTLCSRHQKRPLGFTSNSYLDPLVTEATSLFIWMTETAPSLGSCLYPWPLMLHTSQNRSNLMECLHANGKAKSSCCGLPVSGELTPTPSPDVCHLPDLPNARCSSWSRLATGVLATFHVPATLLPGDRCTSCSFFLAPLPWIPTVCSRSSFKSSNLFLGCVP